jgi:hypothetical protein
MSDETERDEPVEPTEAATALAAAEEPVALTVRLLDDERTPEGMVCMGTYRGDRLIARCVLPPQAWEQVTEQAFFEDAVPVVLLARLAPPGLQCQLFALLSLPTDEGDEEEAPWAASVPGAAYRPEGDPDAEEDGEATLLAFPLGNIVRFERDRVHPDNLAHETADVLRRLIEGRTYEVVDKALEQLLGS